MSICYGIYANLAAQFNEHNINNILCEGLKHKLEYVYGDMSEKVIMPIEEILNRAKEIKIDDAYSVAVIAEEDTFFRLRFYRGSTSMSVFISPSGNAWKNDFQGREAIDFSRYVKLLLDICPSFVINNFYLESDLGLFPYGTLKNTFTILLNMPPNYDKSLSSAREFFGNIKQIGGNCVILRENNFDPADFISYIREGIRDGFERNRAMHMLIEFPESVIQLSIFGSELLFTPQIPMKYKIVDGISGIDIDYYVRLILSITKEFALIELISHF